MSEINSELGKLEDKAADLGAKAGEIFSGAITKIEELKNKFTSLSGEEQGSLIKGAGIGAALITGLGPAISLTGKFTKGLGTISGISDKVTSGIISGIGSIPSVFSRAGNSVGNLIGDFKTLGSGLLQPISPLLSKTSTLIKGTFSQVGSAIATPFKNGFSFISEGLGTLVGNIGLKFPQLTGAIAAFQTNSSDMFSKIGGSISSIFGKVVSFAPAFFKGFNIAAGIGVVIAGLGLLQSNFGDKIDGILQTVTEKGPQIVSKLCTGISNKVPDLIEQGTALINNLLNTITANLPAVLTGGAEILTSLVNGVAGALPKLIPTALDLVITLVNGLINNLPKIVTSGLQLIMGLVQGLVNAISKLIAAAPTLIQNLITAIVNMLPQIITTGIKLITTLAVGLIQAIPQLVAAIPQIISSIKEAFSSVDWASVGKNIINGIKDGLSSVASNLVQAAKDAGKAALDGLKSMLGIHSPSRVFRDEVGQMMALGLGIGFEKNIPVSDMTKSVANAVSSVTGNSIALATNTGAENLSKSTNTMIEDVSLNYAAAAASGNQSVTGFDVSGLGEYIISAIDSRNVSFVNAIIEGIGSMKMTANDREVARFISGLGFAKAGV